MEDKRITEADFEELVCEIWRTRIENKRNDYRRELGIEPTAFKMFDWGMREAFEKLGIEILR